MTTYNTGNALGSSDARDLYDNAENIDNFANGAANTYQDRLGVTRKSLAGMSAAFDDFIESSGYTAPVAYTSGIVLSEYNQLVEYNDEFYKLKAGQSPYTTTGTWGTDSAKLVAVGDAALRQELTANANDFGLLPDIANYGALRAYAGDVTAYYVRGVENIFDGGAGVFRVDSADTTTADNGGTVLVDVSGRRWKREFSGEANLLWFGADPAGVVDSASATQSAIDSSMSVYAPPGRFKITSTVFLRRGLHLRGAGLYNTVFDGSSMTTPVFATQANRYGPAARDQGLRDATLEQFKIVGNTASAANDLIRLVHGFHRAKIRRVWFYSCGGNAIHIDANTGYGGYYDSIEQCIFGDPSDFSSGIDTSLIKGHGIYAIGSCNQVAVRENVFWRTKKDAINLNGSATWSLQRWSVIDNGIEYSGYFEAATPYYGVRINEYVTNVAIERNYIEYNGFNSAAPAYLGGGIYCYSPDCVLVIKDNQFSNHPYNIRLGHVNSATITGNAWLTDCTYFDIKIDSGIEKRVYIGENFDIAASRDGKFLSVPVALQPKVYGDIAAAALRGTNCLVGRFTPRLYGGATEISCSSALANFERVGDRLRVNFSFTVSNLNGATGLIGIAGSDGINFPMPGLGSTIQYPFRNDANALSTASMAWFSLVNLSTNYTQIAISLNQTGFNYAFLREQGDNVANQNLNATALTVGSVLRGEFFVYV